MIEYGYQWTIGKQSGRWHYNGGLGITFSTLHKFVILDLLLFSVSLEWGS